MDLRDNLQVISPLPRWHRDHTPDARHPHRRRFTRSYRRRRALARNLWIGGGLLALLHPAPNLVLVIALATTFLSFVVLDESA